MDKEELFRKFKPKRLYQHKKKSQSGIYIIDSFETDKLYIGSAVNLSQRVWDGHYWSLYNNKHCNTYLQNHVNKYGINDLAFYIVDICSKEELLVSEQWFLDNVNKAIQFNMAVVAGSNLGLKHSEKAKQKQSETHKGKNNSMYGRKHSKEARQKIGEASKGRKLSEGARQKIGEAQRGINNSMYGRKLSEKTRQKMSEAKKGKNNPNYGKISWNKEMRMKQDCIEKTRSNVLL